MSDEEQQCEECVPGLPAWMGTFADLMSLLMCFFVLLLSFAEMDVLLEQVFIKVDVDNRTAAASIALKVLAK